MPSSVAIALGASAATAAAVSTVVIFAAKTLLAVAVSSLFSKKPKQGGGVASDARDQQITARDPVAPWRVIYGEQLVGGTLVFMHATSIRAGEAETVTENFAAAASITVERASQWLSDLSVTAFVDSGDGGYTETLTKVSGAPAAGEYAATDGVYTFNAADIGRGIAINYSATVSAPVIAKFLHLVIELACHECEEIGDIYFDDELVPLDGNGNSTGRFGWYIAVYKHLGSADQLADASLIAYCPDKWTSAHRLRGRAYIYVRMQKNPDLFPNGVPNIRAQVKGRKVYDPRSALTAWSDNNALCVADYLTNTSFGLGHVYADEINETLLIAAANVCDEPVTLAAGGTESRYTCNGTFLTSEQPKDILGQLKVSMGGNIVRVGGKWDIYAGAYITPTITLTEDDLRGAIQVRSRLSRRDLFNGVKGVFASPENGYQPADFPPVTNATYLSEDQGERIWQDVELPYTGTASMAQRLAKIELERVRQQITVVMPCKLSAWRLQPPQTVMLTNSKFGWSAKVFEVVELSLVTDTGEDGAPYLGVDLVLRETAAAVYDWSSGEETTVDPAPDTDLPDPFNVAPPGAPAVTEVLYETTGSAGVKARATAVWGESADAQVLEYGLEFKLSSASSWTRRPNVRAPTDVLDDLTPGTYDFRVRAFSRIGVASAYSGTTTKQINGLSDSPANVAGFSVIKSAGIGVAQWTLHTDLDVQINGAISIRHSPLTTGAGWEDGIIVEEFPGGLISGLVPLITGTYMAKARDSSGNWSAAEVSFVVTEGMVSGFNTVGTSTQHTAFTGAKTNVALDAILGGIKLDGTTLIDSMVTTIDNWPYIDALGGVSATGSYAFDDDLDLTTVATRRFESDITALSFDTSDTIDNRLENIDDWDSFDGAVINDCDVTLYARTTDDDPAGAPTWGAWTPFFVADFTCRAAQFKLDFITGNAQHNIVVTELTVHAKEPA